MGQLKSKRSKACDIPKRVKDAVWERDGHCCIVCGNPAAMPNAHYIPRSQGGLGIEQNIATLCIVCHYAFDQTISRDWYKQQVREYLQSKYLDWQEDDLIYKKYQ